mmetsp:Transcript_13298/g.18763  ORF Transcript_13298/g.18763 Transcript_13298/m.18763 type:complete len:101 (+) Transcript_13298:71-373(+)|eukprot:CAMPEP_0171461374 /NCGR_PEP_ID=MMETSP0945-20130129/5848_1 /TAXON_ID=109269 /ORGANISM="Vaucheria litorea, Strain CCMP2940" /LENGTH=100 /DNA_ID=CAMNT_0011987709 /DNA_START=70 /DNA_END=372 /DNA_ORIENTATION=-
MKFIALIIAFVVASASAFVTSPSKNVVSRTRVQPKMNLDAFSPMISMPFIESTSDISSNNAMLLAEAVSKASDFGGYVGPIVGLITLGGLILVLSPPLAE